MVDISRKLAQIFKLIEQDKYFVIARARQYGKTTTLSQVYEQLKERYLVIKISFEGMGERAFLDEGSFIESFISLVTKRLHQVKAPQRIMEEWEKGQDAQDKLEHLSEKITNLVENSEREIVLLIDEVDKSSNNQLFLHFLGMLRHKYLEREEGLDSTFKSVILVGIYDVKNLKVKFRRDEERKYNSPWNIAADFDVDMSFSPEEISSMLESYEDDYHTGMDVGQISERIYAFSGGYPFLVSKICKLVDEKTGRNWTSKGIEDAVKLLLEEPNTLFDDLVKNLENHRELYQTVYNLLVGNESVPYNVDAHNLGMMYGIYQNKQGRLAIHNKIFEIRIFNYMIARKRLDEVGKQLGNYSALGLYETGAGTLDIKKALLKYQEYMKSVYSDFDKDFIERQGRLLLLAFFKPIINGKGFYFVESHTGFEQRQDVVITYGNRKYIIELKIWRGEEYHQKGIRQLDRYLELESADEGYLVVYDKNVHKQYRVELIRAQDREILAVWV